MSENREQKQYIGMTENDFKARYDMHKQSFNNPKHDLMLNDVILWSHD